VAPADRHPQPAQAPPAPTRRHLIPAGRAGLAPRQSPPTPPTPPRLFATCLCDSLRDKQASALAPATRSPGDDQEEPDPPATHARVRQRLRSSASSRTARATGPFQALLAKSARIQRESADIAEVCAEAHKSRANKSLLIRRFQPRKVADASLDRTQEVAGSTPTSSISRRACTSRTSVRRESAEIAGDRGPFQALVPPGNRGLSHIARERAAPLRDPRALGALRRRSAGRGGVQLSLHRGLPG
jgi:hypothetical protein